MTMVILNGSCQSKKGNIISSDQIDLKWNTKDNKIVAYKTIMEQVGTAEIQMPNMKLFDKLIKSDNNNIKDEYEKINEFFESFYEGTENYSTITTLTSRKDKNIDIKMLVGNFSDTLLLSESDTSQDLSVFKSMMQGVQLRGVINENGGIESFYIKRNQKNILSAFFQLPDHPVKRGDEWQLDIIWLTMDHNFICKESERINKVLLVDIIEKDNEKIAILKYTIYEKIEGDFNSPLSEKSVPIMYEMGLEGICEFSVSHGKWKNYSGLLSYSSNGLQDASYKQKFALIELNEIPEKVYEYLKE